MPKQLREELIRQAINLLFRRALLHPVGLNPSLGEGRTPKTGWRIQGLWWLPAPLHLSGPDKRC